MSYTSVYEVFKTKANCLTELHNGHGSGPAIWDYVSLKCNGVKLPMFGKLDAFWRLWKDQRLDKDEKACLLSTYDYAVVEKKYLFEFAKACHRIHDKIISETEWTWNHFSNIGDTATKLYDKHDHRSFGLGIGCTSVSDPWEFKFNYKECWGVYELIKTLKK